MFQKLVILENTELDVDSINTAWKKATGECEDYVANDEDLQRFVIEGFVERDGDDIAINADIM